MQCPEKIIAQLPPTNTITTTGPSDTQHMAALGATTLCACLIALDTTGGQGQDLGSWGPASVHRRVYSLSVAILQALGPWTERIVGVLDSKLMNLV